MKRLITHTSIWMAVLIFWILFSQKHHPTWLLNILASTVLVCVSAAAVYVNALILCPRSLVSNNWFRYALELLLLMAVLDVLAVLVIQLIYDLIHGPDPARYGFWTNVGLEAVFIGFHVAMAAFLIAISRRLRQNRAERKEAEHEIPHAGPSS